MEKLEGLAKRGAEIIARLGDPIDDKERAGLVAEQTKLYDEMRKSVVLEDLKFETQNDEGLTKATLKMSDGHVPYNHDFPSKLASHYAATHKPKPKSPEPKVEVAPPAQAPEPKPVDVPPVKAPDEPTPRVPYTDRKPKPVEAKGETKGTLRHAMRPNRKNANR